MDGIAFNQCISKCREIVLKLKEIHEFQVFEGFMRGLHLDYEAYVELKQPKDLAEALKFAMIYDDFGRSLKGVFGKGKEKEEEEQRRRGNLEPEFVILDEQGVRREKKREDHRPSTLLLSIAQHRAKSCNRGIR